jgi:hypothetical protein
MKKQRTMALVTANDVLVLPSKLWSSLIDFLQDVNKDVPENKLQRELGALAFQFQTYEQEVIESQQLYMTAHPCGYETWEEDVVERAILRLQEELRILCSIKKNMKGGNDG